MARLLQVGDRVVVIAGDPCCGNPKNIGFIFTIALITRNVQGHCHRCDAIFEEPIAWSSPVRVGEGFLLETLQLIPPIETPALELEKELEIIK